MAVEKVNQVLDFFKEWFDKLVDMFVQCKAWLEGVSAELGESETEAV